MVMLVLNPNQASSCTAAKKLSAQNLHGIFLPLAVNNLSAFHQIASLHEGAACMQLLCVWKVNPTSSKFAAQNPDL